MKKISHPKKMSGFTGRTIDSFATFITSGDPKYLTPGAKADLGLDPVFYQLKGKQVPTNQQIIDLLYFLKSRIERDSEEVDNIHNHIRAKTYVSEYLPEELRWVICSTNCF